MTDEAERAYRRAKIDKGWMSVARLADIKVVPRVHRDDGHLTEWSRNMPKKPPPVTAPEVKEMIADAAAELERKFRDLLAEQARDSQAFVASKIAAYHEGKEMRPVTMEVLAGLTDELLARVGTEARAIAKLRSEHDLRLSALLAEVEKLQRGFGGDRGTVVDLPALPRSRHA